VRRRLLLLVHLPPPVHGVTTVNEMIVGSQLLHDTFDVRVIPLQFAADLDDIGRASPRKAVHAARIAAHLAKQLATWRPDALYVSISPRGAAFIRDAAYVALARALRVPVILHWHGVLPARRSRLVEALLRDCSAIFLSERLAGNARAHAIVPNGIRDVPTTARRPDRQPTRILFLSNLVRSKGPLVLLDALANLRARGVEVTATFAGGAGADDSAALVEKAARELPNVFYVGAVHGEAKSQLYASHDLFVHPTLDDAFPLVLLEAMQHGLPVVSTRVGAIPDIVVDGETGCLVEPGDSDALASRIARLVADSTLCERFSRAARTRYEAKFTSDRFEHTLVSALDTLVYVR